MCFGNRNGVGLFSNDVVSDPGYHVLGVNMLDRNDVDVRHHKDRTLRHLRVCAEVWSFVQIEARSKARTLSGPETQPSTSFSRTSGPSICARTP